MFIMGISGNRHLVVDYKRHVGMCVILTWPYPIITGAVEVYGLFHRNFYYKGLYIMQGIHGCSIIMHGTLLWASRLFSMYNSELLLEKPKWPSPNHYLRLMPRVSME